MIFTDCTIEALKPRDKEYFKRENGSQGFFVKILPSGVKSFLYRHTVDKKIIKVPPGRFPDVSVEEARAGWEIKRLASIPSEHTPDIHGQLRKLNTELTIKDAWRRYELDFARENLAANTVKQYASLLYEMADELKDIPFDSVDDELMFDYLENLNRFKAKGNRMKAAFSSTHRYLRRKRVIFSRNFAEPPQTSSIKWESSGLCSRTRL